jgi:hypothetical protein
MKALVASSICALSRAVWFTVFCPQRVGMRIGVLDPASATGLNPADKSPVLVK